MKPDKMRDTLEVTKTRAPPKIQKQKHQIRYLYGSKLSHMVLAVYTTNYLSLTWPEQSFTIQH